ncbi:VirB4 family type IV secretion system protein [Janthinobacterium lividum]
MLKIKFRETDLGHPLQALCPWIDFITPELVLNKDGSLLAAFDYRGIDPDNVSDSKVDGTATRIEASNALLDSRITAWWIVDKRKDTSYISGEFTSQAAKDLDTIYSRSFTDGEHYTLDYKFYMLFTGETGANKFFDRVERIQTEEGAAIGSAVIKAIKESLSGSRAFAKDMGVLRSNIGAFERIISAFTSASPLNFTRLSKSSGFDRTLATLLNRASAPATHAKPERMMLDSWAPANYVASGPDVIQFKGNTRTVYCAAMGVIKWPDHTSPMLFETLLKMDAELTVCQITRFLNSPESTAEIDKAIEYYNLTQYGLIAHSFAAATGNVAEPKAGKRELFDECKAANARIGSEGITYAYHNLTVFLYGDSIPELEARVSEADQKMSAARFGMIRERLNTLPAFASMLPGQWAMQTRYELMSGENVADCTPMFTLDEGSRSHKYFSSMIFQRPVSSFAVFGNAYGTRSYFSPHVGQIGHLLLIAPTGGGKTTFVNFCLSQFQRYPKRNTYIFDRNYSCKVLTALHDGRHIDIRTGVGKFNPLFAMMDGSPDGQLWVREFILRRFAEGDFAATTEDRADLDTALTGLAQEYERTGKPLRLSTLAAMLPRRLEAELGEWLEGRPYGMFDTDEDDFSLADWTTIEMKDLMAVERLSRAFMDYAFRKIYVSLDGTPTFIYIEEATFLIANPKFKDILDDWLKTFRKKNAFIWMTIQSPEAISNSDIAASILDNIFSFLMLYNEKVEPHRAAYQKYFALADHHIDMIAQLIPKRDYLLIQSSEGGGASTARVLQTSFSAAELAYLRSEETILGIFDRHYASGAVDWKARYLQEVSSM